MRDIELLKARDKCKQIAKIIHLKLQALSPRTQVANHKLQAAGFKPPDR